MPDVFFLLTSLRRGSGSKGISEDGGKKAYLRFGRNTCSAKSIRHVAIIYVGGGPLGLAQSPAGFRGYSSHQKWQIVRRRPLNRAGADTCPGSLCGGGGGVEKKGERGKTRVV